MGRQRSTDYDVEGIQKCLNCTKAECTNCLAHTPKEGPRTYNRCYVVQLKPNSNKAIAVYDSPRAAEEETGVNYKTIYRCMRGDTRSAGGYRWKAIPVR